MKAFLLLLATLLPVAAADITISAGDYDRKNTAVIFRTERLKGDDMALSADGKTFPLQISDDGTASFILPELGKGKELRLAERGANKPAGRLEAKWDNAKGKVGPTAEPWLEYQGRPGALPRPNIKEVFQRGAYLHPLRTQQESS